MKVPGIKSATFWLEARQAEHSANAAVKLKIRELENINFLNDKITNNRNYWKLF